MGIKFYDKYSILHLFVGMICYFLNISFSISVILHIIFEIFENRESGMAYIRKIKIWPGGKKNPDTFLNSIGDTVYFSIGWIICHQFNN